MAPTSQIDPLLSRTSGSIGLVVHSRNQFGPYTRTRTTPTDPNTALQQVVRNALATLTARWESTLTPAQRRSWDRYALAVSRPGRLGRNNNVGGLAMYVRSNVPRIQASAPALPIVDQAPTLLDLPAVSPITRAVLNIVDQTVHVFFDSADPWVTDAGSALLLYASPPAPTTVNFHKAPYRFAEAVLGRLVPAVQSPSTTPLPFAATLTDRVFVRGRVTTSDARLTSSVRIPADIVPQVAPLPTAAVLRTPGVSIFDIFFDSLIRTEAHDTLNWFITRNNEVRNVFRVSPTTTPSNRVTIFTTRGGFAPPGDFVAYTPPPNDMNGLLTGITVAPFAGLPIT